MTANEIHAKIRAGYITPTGNLFCKNCGAVGYNCESRKRYFCARHQFYVHSMGYCPAFSTEKYVADGGKKRDPYKQTYLFKEM
jgi:hypothetical protein